MLRMPFHRDDVAQQKIQLVGVSHELFEQKPDIPVVKHIADIKDDGAGEDDGIGAVHAGPWDQP
jgi:hypothetical protein